MRSSTSASNLRRATWALVAGCCVVALSVEAAARLGLDRASKIQRRMVEEYATGTCDRAGRRDRPARAGPRQFAAR